MRFGVAILAFVAALALNVLGRPLLGNHAPFLFFFSALAFASWYGGFAPGALTTLLGSISVVFISLPVIGSTGVVEIAHLLHIVVFIATGLFISALMKKLHSAIDRSARAERELEMRVHERTVELAQANRALQDEKNRLLGILDRMQEAVYIVNPQYEILYANPAMEREFGPVQGQKCYQYLNGPETGICSCCWRPEKSDGKCFSEEWKSPKNNKVYDRFEAPIAIQNGILCKLMILHDITGLKHTEEELSHRHQEIQRLSSELLTAQETERMRISKELHDELGQSLTLIKLKIGLVNMSLPESQRPLKTHCEDAAAYVDQAIENMRRLSRDLSPVTIETLGITIALRRLAEEFNKADRFQITADIDDIDNILPSQSGILLYRIVQEGLNNIVKHSEATFASISVKKNDDRIHFELKDDGRGLDLRESSWANGPETKGLGLTIMRERVRTLGSSLEILSERDAGTKLRFIIPIKSKERDNERLPDSSRR